MLFSEKVILSVSTPTGSHKLTLTKRIALTPQVQILLKCMFFKVKMTPKDATVGEFVSRKNKD